MFAGTLGTLYVTHLISRVTSEKSRWRLKDNFPQEERERREL